MMEIWKYRQNVCEETQEDKLHGRPSSKWYDNVIMDIRYKCMDYIRLAQDRVKWKAGTSLAAVAKLTFHKKQEISLPDKQMDHDVSYLVLLLISR